MRTILAARKDGRKSKIFFFLLFFFLFVVDFVQNFFVHLFACAQS